MNFYKENYEKYLNKGYSVIPDKFMAKAPAIKSWSDFCYRRPTKEEAESWSRNFEKSNIAVCTGPASGIVALDIDTADKKILDIIKPILPDSPVVKTGAKGETLFFKFKNEASEILKFNGEVILEILSDKKKTTIAPSIHPNGMKYGWKDIALHEIRQEDLPILPPMIISHIQSKLKLAFPDLVASKPTKFESGRNNELSSFCGKLIADNIPVSEAVKLLVEKDKEINALPLFSDPSEMRHTEPLSNALQFYSNHLCTVNTNKARKKEEYEVPHLTGGVASEPEKKSISAPKPKKPKSENFPPLPTARNALHALTQNILSNSYIPQPAFAAGASLSLMASLVSRKVEYSGISPNLYVLHLAPSGAGKNAPQVAIKRFLTQMGPNAEKLLGAGDYVSDAALMDSLPIKPVRLDIIDEASGLLKAATKGSNGFDAKLADILCELYTSSSDKYLGRSLASGDSGQQKIRGSCYRPNVNLLCSTTPAAFSQSVTPLAIERGLLGRFIILQGISEAPSIRIKRFTWLNERTRAQLQWWLNFSPEGGGEELGQIEQDVQQLYGTKEAEKRLDEIFAEFDQLRLSTPANDPLRPIVARLYQQMIKIVILHACGRAEFQVPDIEISDVEFGYKFIKYYYENIGHIIDKHLYSNNYEKYAKYIYNLLENGDVSKAEICRQTPALSTRERDESLKYLREADMVEYYVENPPNSRHMYRRKDV